MNIVIKVKDINKNTIDSYDTKTSLCIVSDDFSKSYTQLIKILDASINKKVSSIYLVGKKSNKIKEECDSIVVNKWMKNNLDTEYLDIFITNENDVTESFEQSIFNFISVNINNKIEKLFIYLSDCNEVLLKIDNIKKELERIKDIWGISYSINLKK